MPWIKMIPPQHATDELRRVYNEIYDLYPGEYKKSVPALIQMGKLYVKNVVLEKPPESHV